MTKLTSNAISVEQFLSSETVHTMLPDSKDWTHKVEN